MQVGSAQWLAEIANHATQIYALNGTPLADLVPILCGNAAGVCLISYRDLRHVGTADCNLFCAIGTFVSAVGRVLVYAYDGLKVLCDATICGDLTTIQKGPWYMKILAGGDILLTFVPVGGEVLKGGEIAAHLGLDIGEHLSAPEAEKLAARIGEEVALACRTMCFPAGTLVATPDGGKPIERVKVGDRVLTEDPKTGKVEAEAVAAVRHDPPSWVMAIGLADGSTIEVTPEHPFWVDRGGNFAGPGWLKAGELRIGDQLRTAGGAEATVVALRYHVERVEVYTLSLGANHDFFVGTARVLVHNCGLVPYGSTDLSKAVQAARIERKDRGGNYAAALLDDGTTIIGRSSSSGHAEDDLVQQAGNRRILDLYSEREPCATSCAPLMRRLGVTAITWSWDWNGVDRDATNAALKQAVWALFQ